MATNYEVRRLALRRRGGQGVSHGAWWPANRCFADEFSQFLALWPADGGPILCARYSQPDWDDSPECLTVAGWRVRTAPFPRANNGLIMLSLFNRQWRAIKVIPPSTPRDVAVRVLMAMSEGTPGPSSPAK